MVNIIVTIIIFIFTGKAPLAARGLLWNLWGRGPIPTHYEAHPCQFLASFPSESLPFSLFCPHYKEPLISYTYWPPARVGQRWVLVGAWMTVGKEKSGYFSLSSFASVGIFSSSWTSSVLSAPMGQTYPGFSFFWLAPIWGWSNATFTFVPSTRGDSSTLQVVISGLHLAPRSSNATFTFVCQH